MRLVSAVLFVALTGALTGTAVLAQEAKPADPQPEVTSVPARKKVPYRVVKMLPETRQVLLFDRIRASHVVAEVGQSLDGYVVEDIDDEEVTLVAENGAQVILTSPPVLRQGKRGTPTKAASAPVDPYADAADAAEGTVADAAAEAPEGTVADASADATGAPLPVDPYADAEAPKTPGEGGVRVASAASPSTATAAPAAGTPSPSAPTAAPTVDAGAPELSDPYGDPSIAAFVDAVGATPAPAQPAAPQAPTTDGKAKAKDVKNGKAKAAPADAASTLAAAATGTEPGASPAPATTAPATTARATTAPASTAPATTASATTAPAPAGGATATLARAELDGALADFGKLAGSFRASFTPDGLRFDSINEGTLLTKVGLRKGDVVTYVDGQPLRSLDDAATLYARASTVKDTAIQVVRDGKLVTLRVAIR